MKNFQLCDNVDLETIFLDYCSYYQLRFGKMPKFVKKVAEPSVMVTVDNSNRKSAGTKRKTFALQVPSELDCSNGCTDLTRVMATKEALLENSLSATLTVSSINQTKLTADEWKIDDFPEMTRPLKMSEHYTLEWKEFADVVCRYTREIRYWPVSIRPMGSNVFVDIHLYSSVLYF